MHGTENLKKKNRECRLRHLNVHEILIAIDCTCAAENGKSCVSGVKRGKARRTYPHFQWEVSFLTETIRELKILEHQQSEQARKGTFCEYFPTSLEL
jgi:hypothetical protein